jgi:hypothetical protein
MILGGDSFAKLRISNSGSVTTGTLAVSGLSVQNAGGGESVAFPGGLELSGSMQFGVSMYSEASGSIDIYLVGYEY